MNRREALKTSIAAAALAGLAPRSLFPPARAAATLEVGVLIPISGPAGLFGPSSENCTRLAVEEINAGGGILGRTVEPVFADVGGPRPTPPRRPSSSGRAKASRRSSACTTAPCGGR